MKLFQPTSSTPPTTYRNSPAVTIRQATWADTERVEVLAELDEARVPPAPLLLAYVGDELWVAASLRTGAVISDPFRPSAQVAALVTERARQLTIHQPRPPLRRIGPRLSLGLAKAH